MIAGIQGRRPSVLHALAMLLKMRLQMLMRPTGKARTAAAQRFNQVWVRYLAVLVVVVLLSVSVTAKLVDVVGGATGRLLLESLLTFASSAGFIALFLLAVPAVMAAFTYKSDLKLLLLTPIAPRLLLAEKFLGIYLQLSVLILLIGIPILLGIGRALNLGPGYSLAVILVLLLLPIAPLALAVLILVGVLRWLPHSWARTITAILGTVFGLGFYIGTQLVTNRGGAGQTANLQQMLTQVPHSWWHSLPTTWLGQALIAAAQGNTGEAITYLFISLALAAALACLAIFLAAHLFVTGWATYQEVGSRGRNKTSAEVISGRTRAFPGGAGAASSSRVSGPLSLRQVWRPLLRKDWLNLRRDPQMLARMAYPLAIAGFGLYRTISNASHSETSTSHGVDSFTFFFTLAMYIYFLTNFLSARLVNREGHSLYLLSLAPVQARHILLVKWAFGALPITAMVEVILLIGAVFLHLSAWAVVLSFFTFGSLAIAMIGGALTLSLIWPRLDWDNPNRQVSTQALLFTAVGGLILSAGTCALLAAVLGWTSSRPQIALAAGIGIFAINGGVSVVSLIVGTRAMIRLLHGDT